MPVQPPKNFDEVGTTSDTAGAQLLPTLAADPDDYLGPAREDGLSLLKPDHDWMRVLGLVAVALVAGFGLGWASGSSWSSASNVAALNPVQKDAFSPRPETKSAGRSDAIRKVASTVSGGSPKPPAIPARPESESSRTITTGTVTIPTAAPVREPMVAAPETRPTTIEGWTVREVRGGAAVLEGPDGVRTASPGDIVPGLGRIDSIVRWGNYWIVATASGLIATP